MSTTRKTSTILLLARKGGVLDEAKSQLLQGSADATDSSTTSSSSSRPGLRVYTGTTVDDLRSAFDQASKEGRTIQHVFVGAGLELEHRLDIVKEAVTLSKDTCVHLKDATSGPTGFLPFIKAVQGSKLEES
ncbi:uncharacterized protein Z520_00303 [Fonsecaea multimorphosa CBS 102226]|uniref:Uncharacterized protein n=1 Tax=Fonsecaea multimorphosa CBS 102226 TaxID=1442371 RepID=A0A0D2J2F4_9EURO|nr:uncharacterized protein Z520_00303 [Fonsecaea multimorphosa CBS 102226]KIY03612.1 hypothetical protein Z520_00303 [Fonsecaea multimorphosa CBS 102226]OAL32313.1 hypothetical protein AYO22_00335 [Fonsecaea multimorphosa]